MKFNGFAVHQRRPGRTGYMLLSCSKMSIGSQVCSVNTTSLLIRSKSMHFCNSQTESNVPPLSTSTTDGEMLSQFESCSSSCSAFCHAADVCIFLRGAHCQARQICIPTQICALLFGLGVLPSPGVVGRVVPALLDGNQWQCAHQSATAEYSG